MRKTLYDLKPRDKVFFVNGNSISTTILSSVSIHEIHFEGFEGCRVCEDDKTRRNIEIKQKYGSVKVLHFNKIDALKSLKDKRKSDLSKFNEKFKYLIEELEETQKELFQIEIEIIEETKKL